MRDLLTADDPVNTNIVWQVWYLPDMSGFRSEREPSALVQPGAQPGGYEAAAAHKYSEDSLESFCVSAGPPSTLTRRRHHL